MFSNIATSRYRLDDSYQVVDQADKIVKTISGEITSYSNILDRTLRNQILSRIVSSLFLSSMSEVFNKYPYITIQVDVGDEELTLTLGQVPNDTGVIYLNGVLEL